MSDNACIIFWIYIFSWIILAFQMYWLQKENYELQKIDSFEKVATSILIMFFAPVFIITIAFD